jgi:hypothetical protein
LPFKSYPDDDASRLNAQYPERGEGLPALKKTGSFTSASPVQHFSIFSKILPMAYAIFYLLFGFDERGCAAYLF